MTATIIASGLLILSFGVYFFLKAELSEELTRQDAFYAMFAISAIAMSGLLAVVAFNYVEEADILVEPPPSAPTAAISEEKELATWDNCLGTENSAESLSEATLNECPKSEESEEVISEPIHLIIDAITVNNPIINVGLEEDGAMEIPEDIFELGWYELGVRPGELGSAVIAGHVDSREQGMGAFFDLRFLREGDSIITLHEEGEQLSWTVYLTEQYNKPDMPMEELFRQGGTTKELVLITCGGQFDPTARSYEDNFVVYAILDED